MKPKFKIGDIIVYRQEVMRVNNIRRHSITSKVYYSVHHIKYDGTHIIYIPDFYVEKVDREAIPLTETTKLLYC